MGFNLYMKDTENKNLGECVKKHTFHRFTSITLSVPIPRVAAAFLWNNGPLGQK